MQFAKCWIADVVEQGRRKDAFVARKVNWFQKWRLIDIVRCAPRTVHPVGTSFQYVVLEVVLVFQQDTDGFSLFGELLQSPEVPFVQLGEVVFRHAVPCQFLSRTGKGLFVEGSPCVTILTANAFMVITTTISPQTSSD